jgi:hypothetical protein
VDQHHRRAAAGDSVDDAVTVQLDLPFVERSVIHRLDWVQVVTSRRTISVRRRMKTQPAKANSARPTTASPV